MQPLHLVAPFWFWNSPVAQGAQLGWLVPDCDVPAAQGVHARSTNVKPAKEAMNINELRSYEKSRIKTFLQ